MKDTIYTIPVMEALENAKVCPFCTMYANLEQNAINFLMGPSVAYMEEDIRKETNKLGFCSEHIIKMHGLKNRLGLALMLHTHFIEINKNLTNIYKSYSKKTQIFLKKENILENYLHNLQDNCYICSMIEKSYIRYIDTFFALFSKENKIAELLEAGSGICLKHLGFITTLGQKKLSNSNFSNFTKIIFGKQQEQMQQIESNIDWFIKKFDYRYTDEPWKNSKDSVEQAIEKLTGINLKKEG